MKYLTQLVLLGSLCSLTGCTLFEKRTPEPKAERASSAKPDDKPIPSTISRILPEEINEENGSTKALEMERMLLSEQQVLKNGEVAERK